MLFFYFGKESQNGGKLLVQKWGHVSDNFFVRWREKCREKHWRMWSLGKLMKKFWEFRGHFKILKAVIKC